MKTRKLSWLLAAQLLMLVVALGGQPALAKDAPSAAVVTIDTDKSYPINRDIFGVNNMWNIVSKDEFPDFITGLREKAGATLFRFPGGWESEWLDWQSNTAPGWKKAPDQPGASVENVLASGLKPTFVVATREAMTDPKQLDSTVERAVALVSKYSNRVTIWEIGNEWWLQDGARKSAGRRSGALQNYAAIIRAMAPQMKKTAPGIKIFINGDWTKPQEFAQLKQLVGETGWAAVDGISIHPYCGDRSDAPLCLNIGAQASAIRASSGKSSIYASEWATARAYSTTKTSLGQGNLLVAALSEMARGHIDAAAYWPAARIIPRLALLNANFRRQTALGAVFQAAAKNFRGRGFETDGSLPLLAASPSPDKMIIIVPSMSPGGRTVKIQLKGAKSGGWTLKSSAAIISSKGPNLRWPQVSTAEIEQTGLAKTGSLSISLNDQKLRLGSAWEVAIITLTRGK
jgi:hypothetical protein